MIQATKRAKFHVKKGDYVQVISGAHVKAEGKILQILPKKSQVLIEGVRLIKRHTRKSQDNPNGGIIEREGPIHISNVKVVEKEEKKGKKTEKAPKAAKAEAAEKPAKGPRKKKSDEKAAE